jgi:hypothetical protein
VNRELLLWRSSAAIVGVTVILGALQGVLWSLIAPGEQFVVYTDGQYLPLPTESYHQFTSIAIFVLIGAVVAIAVATAVWHWRSIRGLTTVLVVAGANGLGALTAYLVGRAVVSGVDPASIGATRAAAVVTAAPSLGSAMVLIAQPAIAVAAYTLLVAWSGRSDLAVPTPPPAA